MTLTILYNLAYQQVENSSPTRDPVPNFPKIDLNCNMAKNVFNQLAELVVSGADNPMQILWLKRQSRDSPSAQKEQKQDQVKTHTIQLLGLYKKTFRGKRSLHRLRENVQKTTSPYQVQYKPSIPKLDPEFQVALSEIN